MKKYYRGVLTIVLAVIAYLPISVYAIDISQADFDSAKNGTPSNGVIYNGVSFDLEPGEYKFITDIDLGNYNLNMGYCNSNGVDELSRGDYVLDLNKKKVTLNNDTLFTSKSIEIQCSNVVIKGNGKIEKKTNVDDNEMLYFINSNVTIENGDFLGLIRIYHDNISEDKTRGSLIVNSGNFRLFYVHESDLIINDANVNSLALNEQYSAINVSDNSQVTINGGTFKGSAGLIGTGTFNKAVNITINDGTFIGGDYGINISYVNLKIIKGLFKGGKAGIGAEEGMYDFDEILANGSIYSPELQKSTIEGYDVSQKEISVIKENNQNNTDNSNNNNQVTEDIKFLDGANQKVTISKDNALTFRINTDYDAFYKDGKVYVDDKLVDAKYYELSKGSTVIKFTNEFAKTLSVGEHTIKVKLNDKEASTKFTVSKNTINPKTGDNILISLIAAILCITVLTTYYSKKFKSIENE